MNNMTRELAIKLLKRCQGHRDKEGAHIIADQVLLDLLETLGYEDVVEEFEKVAKWYA